MARLSNFFQSDGAHNTAALTAYAMKKIFKSLTPNVRILIRILTSPDRESNISFFLNQVYDLFYAVLYGPFQG